MSQVNSSQTLRWDCATGLTPLHYQSQHSLQGMLVPDIEQEIDRVAVVYEKGNPPPEITIRQVSGFVHTVLANGLPVAVIARAVGPAVSIDEVLLVEQCV